MGKARSISLGTRDFDKVGDASAFFRSMLARYPVGTRVSHDDAQDLMALLARHDEVVEKIGPGLDYFEVEAAPGEFPGKCFWIVRSDGSRIDFSYKHCLERKTSD